MQQPPSLEHLGKSAEVKFWRDPDLPCVEIRFSRYSGAAFSRHAHDTFSVGLVEEGWSSFFCRGANHSIGAGEIAVIPPGEIHSCNPRSGTEWTYRMFYIDADWLRHAASEVLGVGLAGLPRFSTCTVRDGYLAEQLRHLHRLVESGADRLEKECAMVSSATALLLGHGDDRPRRSEAPREPKAVKLVKDYIEANYAETISLKDLSDLTGLSAYHLLRVFRASAGVPPHAYLVQKRLNKAREMLSKGRPIVDVALEIGFSDQSHFTRAFKGAAGITPRGYRMAQRSPS
ncbi:MAG: AraC family ligand binding domain-containing protein [Acidobacteriota bacterium]